MIPEGLLDEISIHAQRESPREICGFLAGRDGVQRTFPVPNVAKDPEREFLMEPQAQIDTMREIRASGMELLGTYHSHPKTPPVPSVRDLQLALYPDIAHLIVSLAGDGPEFGLWRISSSGYKELDLG